MAINKIGVLGAGTMGAGIAQICAEAGLQVLLVDMEEAYVNRGLSGIMKSWDKAVEKGKKDAAETAKYKELISTGVGNEALGACDFIIEAVFEEIEIKKSVMKDLNARCAPDVIFATNTSALSITEIAAASGRPDKVIGMHFFNPVPAMKLVEVIPGAETAPAVCDTVVALCEKIGKEAISMPESPGFIVNRILLPYINEAAILFQEGIASAEQIDQAMKLGANMPMGPLALADLIGLDVCLKICTYFWTEFGDSKYRPALSIKQKVRAGHLGRKTGKGFYVYN